MLQSKLLYKIEKLTEGVVGDVMDENVNLTRSVILLSKDSYVDKLMAGVYTFLPLGYRVLRNIENIIRKNMEEIGGQELLMPVLQPKENWEKTGRWETLDILFKVKGSGDKDYAMGPTHEEVVSPLVKRFILSYKNLPLSVFQIQTKFRDELRAKSGILRTREFLMKDLYSFHSDQEDLDAFYEKAIKTYEKIFKEVGIGDITYRTLASGGSFSKYSDEFQMVTEAGEDLIYICKKCGIAINKEIKSENTVCPMCKGEEFEEKKAVEVGNIFKLGTKYSAPFDLKFKDKNGSEKLVVMGCYGIGLSRLMGAIVEASHDEKGIVWPESVAPFRVHLIPVGQDKKVWETAQKLYTDLQEEHIEILYDDREEKSAGEKFAEADLLGIPYRIVISEKTLAEKSVEVKHRATGKMEIIKIKDLVKKLT